MITHNYKLPSGRMGWKATLQENYDNSKGVWFAYCEVYGLHKKLGFSSPLKAWEANPTICGSTNPSDFGIAPQ